MLSPILQSVNFLIVLLSVVMFNVVMLNVVRLSLIMLIVMLSHLAECHYAECRYAECHYAESRYAECRYAECRGSIRFAIFDNFPAPLAAGAGAGAIKLFTVVINPKLLQLSCCPLSVTSTFV
jgi:hypothetical protein